MKHSKGQPRLAVRSPLRAVSIQIRENQVTVKVRGPVLSTTPRPTLFR